jgi:hypothetical protein
MIIITAKVHPYLIETLQSKAQPFLYVPVSALRANLTLEMKEEAAKHDRQRKSSMRDLASSMRDKNISMLN